MYETALLSCRFVCTGTIVKNKKNITNSSKSQKSNMSAYVFSIFYMLEHTLHPCTKNDHSTNKSLHGQVNVRVIKTKYGSVGGKLLHQHRALLRNECRNVHFALVATCAPALQSPTLDLEPLTNMERNIRLVAMSAVLRSGMTMKRQKDAKGMCLLRNDRSD